MSSPLFVAFVWHMHQPYYRDAATGACAMPWVRLHATKDYLDMVERLEAFPAIHQTFNVVPSLLDQLEEYLPPANRSDEFLDHSRTAAARLSGQEQRFLLKWFFMANVERMIKPHPRYNDLLAKRGLHVGEHEWDAVQRRFRTQDFLDLQVWFNLVWIDPWLRTQDAELTRIENKEAQFTEEDKRLVLQRQMEMLARVIPAYRAAMARGQVELTTSPYYHPILPLLCDTRSAHVALPQLPLPAKIFRHPDDARAQLQRAVNRHQSTFGQAPQGLWPSEGSVSQAAVQLAAECGFRWLATDEEILWRTLRTGRAPELLYRPHLFRHETRQVAMVFRDRELSDLLGFVYSQWEASAAAEDFLGRLGRIHARFERTDVPALVTIVLDGENAWESYLADGHDFFQQLYQRLAQDARFRCVTVSEFLQQYPPAPTAALPALFSGSWIDGNFSTWIGHAEKNLAWQYLAEAREALDGLSREDPSGAEAWMSLDIAEGSDWMWWFGDTHYSAQADEFDRLFRTHLTNAYRAAGLEPPAALAHAIRHRPPPSVYEPTGSMTPVIDGRETSYYEWLYAGQADLTQQHATMHHGSQCLRKLFHGFDASHQYVRIDLEPARLPQAPWTIELELAGTVRIVISREDHRLRAILASGRPPTELPCALRQILELAIPMTQLCLSVGQRLTLLVSLKSEGEVLERYPTHGSFALVAHAADLDTNAWLV